MLDRLGGFLYRRRRAVLWASLAVVLAAGVFGGPVFGLLDSGDDFDDPQAEAVLASRDVQRATGANASPDLVALVRLGAPADSAEAQGKLAQVAAALRDPGIARVARYERGGDRNLVSKDGRSSYVVATFRADDGGALERVQPKLERMPGVTVGGGELAQEQVGDQVSEDIARAELLAFPILFLLSLFVFRGVVAALLPLAVGGATIMISFLAMRFVNGAIEPMSIFALNLITGLGLGLAIDYSLFMVSRFREELERGLDTSAAIRVMMNTAGRTVLFSSITVAAALAALLVFPLRFLYSMGVGGTICALAAALVSLTILPAILAALGPRVNSLSPKRWQAALHREASDVRGGFWYRLSQTRDAPPGPVRGRRHGAADRARPAVPRHPVHRRRRHRAAARGPLRARRPGRARHGVPAQPHEPGLRRRARRRRRPRRRRALRARAGGCARGRRRAAGAARGRALPDRPRGARASARRAGEGAGARRARGRLARAGARGRPDRRLPRPAEGAGGLAAARARRSSRRRRSSSCSS